MYRQSWGVLTIAAAMMLVSWSPSQEKDAAFVSGPQAGQTLPGPFDAYNVNGPRAKGRFHCLVCEYGHDPVVMVFAREPQAGQDAAFNDLLAKLDAALATYKDDFLRSFVVFLSPAARNSTTEDKVEDPAALVKEAEERAALLARLAARAANLKHVVLSCTVDEKIKDYKINAKAEVTVIFYRRMRVLDNFAFETGKMTPEEAAAIVDKVGKRLRPGAGN